MLILLPITAALCSLALRFVLGRPRFPARSGDAGPAPRISIIIPARNEEANIGGLLESIRNQSASPCEVIVVDDHSQDRTAANAASFEARIVQAPALPEDWKGKPWACQHGAQAAIGDWLLFLDADTRLEPGAFGEIAHLARDPGRVSSICPYHHIERPYEELSAFFNVIMLAGINSFGIQRDPSSECALFGQCLLIHQDAYRQMGGHHSVRGEILENFHLARQLAARGIPRDCFLGRGLVRMRMFPSGFHELWSSWKKGFSGGAGHTAPRALIFCSIWLTGAMSACVAPAFAPSANPGYGIACAAVYLIYAAQCHTAFRLAGNFSLLNALLFPISLLFYQALFFISVIERRLGIKTRWKGRHVD